MSPDSVIYVWPISPKNISSLETRLHSPYSLAQNTCLMPRILVESINDCFRESWRPKKNIG